MLVERPWVALVHSTSCCTTGEQTLPRMNGLAKSGTRFILLTSCYPTSKEAPTSHHQATRPCERTLPSTAIIWHSTTTYRTINRFMFPGRITSRPFLRGQSKRCVPSVSTHRPVSIMARFKDQATLSPQSLHKINIGILLRLVSWNMR